jgi:hypothetical protein
MVQERFPQRLATLTDELRADTGVSRISQENIRPHHAEQLIELLFLIEEMVRASNSVAVFEGFVEDIVAMLNAAGGRSIRVGMWALTNRERTRMDWVAKIFKFHLMNRRQYAAFYIVVYSRAFVALSDFIFVPDCNIAPAQFAAFQEYLLKPTWLTAMRVGLMFYEHPKQFPTVVGDFLRAHRAELSPAYVAMMYTFLGGEGVVENEAQLFAELDKFNGFVAFGGDATLFTMTSANRGVEVTSRFMRWVSRRVSREALIAALRALAAAPVMCPPGYEHDVARRNAMLEEFDRVAALSQLRVGEPETVRAGVWLFLS